MRSVLDVLGLRTSKTTMESVTTVLVFGPGEHDEAVRITDSAGRFDFQIASKEIAGLPV
jgi:hypothetical protein